MPAPTRDILWFEVAAILERRMFLTTQPLQLCVESSALLVFESSCHLLLPV